MRRHVWHHVSVDNSCRSSFVFTELWIDISRCRYETFRPCLLQCFLNLHFVFRVCIGMHEADTYGFNVFRTKFLNNCRNFIQIQRFCFFSLEVYSSGNFKSQVTLNQRFCHIHLNVVNIFSAVSTSDFQNIFESSCGNQCRSFTFLLRNHINHDSSTVNEFINFIVTQSTYLHDLFDTVHDTIH